MTDPLDKTVLSEGGAPRAGEHDEAYCSACNQSFAMDRDVCPNDGARLIKLKASRDVLVGRVFDQRYELRAQLGHGGMGTVYRAHQLSVDREVAIKVIHPKLATDRTAVKRFLREARLASRLSQPNIVNVYDFGQTEDGILYLVMEMLRGHTLAEELEAKRALPVRRVVTIALQLCDALEVAHGQGIVHRDLKPSNIVILDEPPGRDLVKVLDFGLAKSLVSDTTSLTTNSDAILGTPLYMPPEQIGGTSSDARADLYSLGCILHHALSGGPPFVRDSVNLVLAAHLHERPPALPANVPPRLAAVIARMMEKEPAQRPSASEVRTVMQGIEQPEPDPRAIATTAPRMPTVEPEARPTVGAQSLPGPRSPRRRVRWIAGGLALATGLAAGAVVVLRHGGDRVAAPDAVAPVAAPSPAAPVPVEHPPLDATVTLAVPADAAVPDAPPPVRDAGSSAHATHAPPRDAGTTHANPVDAAPAPDALPSIDFLHH